MTDENSYWTLVQHSAAIVDETFENHLEEAIVFPDALVPRIAKAGGFLFENYVSALRARLKLEPMLTEPAFSELATDSRLVFIPTPAQMEFVAALPDVQLTVVKP